MATGNVFRVSIRKHCDKQIRKAPPKIRQAVSDALEEIRNNPYHNPNVKELKGELAGIYRYQIGGYRLSYIIDEDDIVVIAVDFSPRGDAYK